MLSLEKVLQKYFIEDADSSYKDYSIPTKKNKEGKDIANPNYIPRNVFDEIYDAFQKIDNKEINNNIKNDLKTYWKFVCKWYIELNKSGKPNRLVEDLPKIVLSFAKFIKFRNQMSVKDPFQIKSEDQLNNMVKDFKINSIIPNVSEIADTNDEYKNFKDTTLIYNKNGWLLLSPNNYKADCYWGVGSKWCTANYGEGFDETNQSKRSEDYFNDYATANRNKEPILIIMKKKSGEIKSSKDISTNTNKWQFQFGDVKGFQFKGNDDKEKDVIDWRKEENPPKDLLGIIYNREYPDQKIA